MKQWPDILGDQEDRLAFLSGEIKLRGADRILRMEHRPKCVYFKHHTTVRGPDGVWFCPVCWSRGFKGSTK